MLQDLRFTFRLLVKERWFSAAAVTVLALGIGVNAIGFTVVNAAFLRGLPYKDADRLYVLSWQAKTGREPVSPAEFLDWRSQSRTFDLSVFTESTFNVSDERDLPEPVRGSWVSANAFRLLGQPTLIGRDFADDEEGPGHEPVVIIGYRLWRSRYGGDPAVLGRTLRIEGASATIVGVMPESMKFPFTTEIWGLHAPKDTVARDARSLMVFGRLREGTDVAAARAEMAGIATRLRTAYPDTNGELAAISVETFSERFVGGKARRIFPVIMGAACFVLLIACANMANLLLARSAYRAREIAVRTAMGATRWRIVRQLLAESLVLGFLGGGFGLLIAYAAGRAMDAGLDDPGKPFWITFNVDGAVLGYVTAICVVTAVLFGLAPALHVSKTNLNDLMKEGGRGSAGNRRIRSLSGAMIVGELALTIVLLAGAGLMVRSVMHVSGIDIGFSTEHVTAMRLDLPGAKYPTADARRAFYDQLVPRLATVAGAEAIAVTSAVPPFSTAGRTMEIEGRPGDGSMNVTSVAISPRFFDAAGVSVRRGRAFGETDGAPGFEHVIVNEQAVAQFFQGGNPIGTRVRFVQRPRAGRPAPPPGVWRTIVGVSPSIRHGAVGEATPNPVVYIPHRHEPPSQAWLMVRSGLEAGPVMDAIRRVVRDVDQDQPVFSVQTLDAMVARNFAPLRVFGGLFMALGVIALVLSAVGLYGVMAYSVAQRTQEIGVRMALGAGAAQVSWLVLRRGLWQVGLGLSIGLAGALAMSRLLRSVLIQVTPADPVTFVAITAILAAVAAVACLIPAHRATKVDPLIALRAE